ncbi:MAG: hypothetical protein A2381_15290 [Bdellovibrionales bacterium RIFOXYB1_FULL_37_110]|nr:MAG: hypothetical protein A2381_15290 [Bdellovibrionales bacterium RIFOXYB1_FULL_37_110]
MAIYVSNADSVPKCQHWAILKFQTIHIPGDERSRTNPGHGYGPSTETTCSYVAYMNEQEWVVEVQKLASRAFPSDDFIAIKVIPATITTKVSVSVS